MAVEFTSYLHTLVRQLHLGPREEREIALELQGHLEDNAAELKAQGIDQDTAQALAMQRMGNPAEVARKMYGVHSPALWRDIALATIPHFLLAALFALRLWSHYFLVALVLIGITLVTWRNWRAGNPSKWSYSWLGYTLAAPALSWLLALITLGYGGWTLLTTGQLPFNTVFFLLLIGYVPFSMWVVGTVVAKVIRRDWLLASLSALPFPFLTSWLLFLNWEGGLWDVHRQQVQESDTDRALIFLALAITTAAFLKIGPRLVKIGLLTISTAVLVIVTAAALPVGFNALAIILMVVASLAFLLSPAVLDSQLGHRGFRRTGFNSGTEVVTHWFASHK